MAYSSGMAARAAQAQAFNQFKKQYQTAPGRYNIPWSARKQFEAEWTAKVRQAEAQERATPPSRQQIADAARDYNIAVQRTSADTRGVSPPPPPPRQIIPNRPAAPAAPRQTGPDYQSMFADLQAKFAEAQRVNQQRAFDLAQMQIQEQRRIAEQRMQQMEQQRQQQLRIAEQQRQQQLRIAEQRMQQMEQQRQQQLRIAEQQIQEQRRIAEEQMQKQQRQLQVSAANQGMSGSGQVQFSQSKADRKKLTTAGTRGYFGRGGLRIQGLNVSPAAVGPAGSFA